MTLNEIIANLEDQARDKDSLAGGDPDSIFTHDADVLMEAANILRRQQKNDLLTLEELREIDGEPMWISGEGIGRYDICCGISSDNVVQFYKAALPIYSYGRTWMAYCRKPEEVQT